MCVCVCVCVRARRKVTAKAAAADKAAKVKVGANQLLRLGMRETVSVHQAVDLVDGEKDSPDAPDSRSKKRKTKDDLRAEEMHG